jgi:formate/nitrite transporter FocA (FNT family)
VTYAPTERNGSRGSLATPRPGREEPEIEEAFDRLVEEGHDRLERPLLSLCATGFVGGIDVAVGVLAYLFVEEETGQSLLGALAFSIGFIALLLARSELFTENFLVPVIAAVAKRGSLVSLVRLWLVTLAMNLAGGLVFAGLAVVALPSLHSAAITAGSHYAHLGVSARSFCLAVLAGAVITLLTRMQYATDSFGVKLVPAVVMPFVLVGAQLFHSVLDSILMFAGLLTNSADYSWLDWLGALGWSAFGNLVGGLGLVTSIRLLRVTHRVQEQRQANAGAASGAS